MLFGSMPTYKNVPVYTDTINPPKSIPASNFYNDKRFASSTSSKQPPASIQKETTPNPIEKSPQRTENPVKPEPSSTQVHVKRPVHEVKKETSFKPSKNPDPVVTHQPQKVEKKIDFIAVPKSERTYIHTAHERLPPPKPKEDIYSLHQTFKSQKKAEEVPTMNQARLLYRKKKEESYPNPKDIAETVTSEIQRNKDELRTLVHQQKREIDEELSKQVQTHNTMKKYDQEAQRELHNMSKGFEFEWYTRHPKMLAENADTKHFQKFQKGEDYKRKQAQIIEDKKKPPSVLTPEEYEKLAKESKQELYEAKRSMEQELKKNYDDTTKSAKVQAQFEREQKLQEEIEKINHTKK